MTNQYDALVIPVLLIHDPVGGFLPVFIYSLLVFLEWIRTRLQPASRQIIGARMSIELSAVDFIRTEENGNTIFSFRHEQSMDTSLNAFQTVAAHTIAQNNQAGCGNGINGGLQGFCQLFGDGMQAIVHESDAVFQFERNVAGEQSLKDPAANEEDG